LLGRHQIYHFSARGGLVVQGGTLGEIQNRLTSITPATLFLGFKGRRGKTTVLVVPYLTCSVAPRRGASPSARQNEEVAGLLDVNIKYFKYLN
jgi:hypothetical protein